MHSRAVGSVVPLGVISGGAAGVLGIAAGCRSWLIGTLGFLVAEPPNRAAPATTALTTTAALAAAIRGPVPVTQVSIGSDDPPRGHLTRTRVSQAELGPLQQARSSLG